VADRWHWNFDEADAKRRPSGAGASPAADAPPASAPAPAPAAPQPPSPAARRVRIRRGRALVALLVLAVALVVGAAALAHTGGKHRTPPRALSPTRRADRDGPRQLPENDKNAAVASVLAYTPFVREGSGHAREVALTFDDGPGPYTPQVLSVLERYRVHATFFVIGRMLQYFGASAMRELRDGDVIGDHTETHPALARLSAHDQYEQLFEQIARVELIDGPRPVLFRPPYGSFDATTLRELRKLHLLMVLWSVDTGDYQQPGVATIVQRALEGAHPGAILLLHDAGGTRLQTVAALPLIIKGLRARGLKPVTVPQLLHDDPPPVGLPLPSNLSGD
jgi:peptidoglycan/xylan/chitin deacetylase (PgdA/CDA1 family)